MEVSKYRIAENCIQNITEYMFKETRYFVRGWRGGGGVGVGHENEHFSLQILRSRDGQQLGSLEHISSHDIIVLLGVRIN